MIPEGGMKGVMKRLAIRVAQMRLHSSEIGLNDQSQQYEYFS